MLGFITISFKTIKKNSQTIVSTYVEQCRQSLIEEKIGKKNWKDYLIKKLKIFWVDLFRGTLKRTKRTPS